MIYGTAAVTRGKAMFFGNTLFQVVLDALSIAKLLAQVLRGREANLAIKIKPQSERQSIGVKLEETQRLLNDRYAQAHTKRVQLGVDLILPLKNASKNSRIVGCALMGITSLLLGACASIGPDPRDLRIETSVSSDGQWIAVLQNAGTATSQVKVMRMDERKWIDVKAPARTSSIRFGLNPAQLLLTSWKSSEDSAAELSVIHVNHSDYPRTTMYEGYGLGYPMELEDGQILVRGCYPTTQNRCHRYVGVHWLLISEGKVKTRYTSVRPINYSQPNYIRGVGFYWNIYKTSELAPPESIGFDLRGWPVDEKNIPLTSIIDGGLDCDYQNIRCMKAFITNRGMPGPFIYDVKFSIGQTKCQTNGFSGWSDGMSITPDGNFGVKSLAKDWESSRHVVYIKFQPEICEPIDIQHIEIS